MMSFISALPGAISQGLIWGIMAIGVYITYKILDIADLTVDGSFCTGGAVFAVLFGAGVNIWLALLAALAAGMLAGLVTGILHTFCGIPAILSGILTQLALWSVNMAIMGMKASVAISVTNPSVLDKLLVSLRFVSDVASGTRPFYRHPIFVVGLFTAVIIAALYWFFGTEMGSSLRATGANGAMARAQGINTNFTKVLGLVVSNGLVALSGALLAQYNGANEINVGRGAIVIGLAAVIIGEVLFKALLKNNNFAVRMAFTVVGSVLYYVFIGFALWLKMPTNDMKLITAIIVAIFLAVPYLQEKKHSSFARAAKKGGK